MLPKHSLRSGLTLLELLLVIGMISVISGVVSVALSPRKNLLSAYDTGRQHNSKQLQQAMSEFLIDEWEMAGKGQVPESQPNARPICKTTTNSIDCTNINGIDLSALPPQYIASMPVDPAEPEGSLCTGYMVYREKDHAYIFSAHQGKMPNESTPTCCVSGGDPYTICTCEDLKNINNLSGVFEIGSSTIDCSLENDFTPIAGEFNGVLDGENRTIRNLTINKIGTQNVGLFEYIGTSGILRNLRVENANVTGENQTGIIAGMVLGNLSNVHVSGVVNGNGRSGGLAGFAAFGTIDHSSSTAAVEAVGSNPVAGGLVGNFGGGTISNSFATGDITSLEPVHAEVGGLVGSNVGGTITNTYALGTVRGAGTSNSSGVGGLVGGTAMGWSVINSYATGKVYGPLRVGGLIGKVNAGLPVNSYWYDNAGDDGTQCVGSGGACPAVGDPSAFYAQGHAVYTGSPIWNFTTIWNPPSGGYPTLR